MKIMKSTAVLDHLFFTLLMLIQLVFVTSTHLNTDLEAVFLEAIGTTTLANLLGGKSFGNNKTLNSSCLSSENKYSSLRMCLKSKCLNADELAQLYSLSLDTPLNATEVNHLAPAVLYLIHQRNSCQGNVQNVTLPRARPSPSAVWGFSFLFVTIINLCSLTGILFLPCMKSSVYKVLLMFMVALAVGTLLASSVLVLIPEAFELTHLAARAAGNDHDEASHKYIWTSTSIIGGVYMFFIMERVMRLVNLCRENTKEKRLRDKIATRGTMTSSFARKTPPNANLKLKDPSSIFLEVRDTSNCICLVDVSEPGHSPERSITSNSEAVSERYCDVDDEVQEEQYNINRGNEAIHLNKEGNKSCSEPQEVSNHNNHIGHSHSFQRQGSNQGDQVAPVAYMVIFGDSLHNLIDGLSIGAAFTDNILLGISVSVAVMCEELPHELGDFAILLNAGMRVRKALLFNFMSSLMCYVGVLLGIIVGENTTAHTWIFGLAGGMFLYISLVDMVPEMNSVAESKDGKQFGLLKTFLLQNIGFLLGYIIILMMALHGSEINFE